MITLATIKDLSDKMKAAPRIENQNRRIGKAEALQKLIPSMKIMQGNGHDPEQIAAMLADAGLQVSGRALARLLKPKTAAKPQQKG
jgi:hypothetical protein